MTQENMDRDRRWRNRGDKHDDQERYYGDFRYTPFTTDLGFFSDPSVYQAKDVARTTQYAESEPELADRPRGNRRQDNDIEAEIHRLLKSHGQVDASDIHVSTQDGVVTLTGSVHSPSEIRVAEGITRNVLGVLDVYNNLMIRSQTDGEVEYPPQEEIKMAGKEYETGGTKKVD